jgi:hypothetical protein
LSGIQTVVDLSTDEDLDEMIAAQEKFLDAVGFGRKRPVGAVGEIVGKLNWDRHSLTASK